jgi:hypothetical protein
MLQVTTAVDRRRRPVGKRQECRRASTVFTSSGVHLPRLVSFHSLTAMAGTTWLPSSKVKPNPVSPGDIQDVAVAVLRSRFAHGRRGPKHMGGLHLGYLIAFIDTDGYTFDAVEGG